MGKKKLGRPPLSRQIRRDDIQSFRLTKKEKQVLYDYCWRYEQSPSVVIRDSLAILGIIPDWY